MAGWMNPVSRSPMWRKVYPRSSSSCRQCQATRPMPDSREMSIWAMWTMVVGASAGIYRNPGEHDVAQRQPVHAGAQEAVQRLGRSVDDRLVLVERGVEHHGHARPLLEGADELPVAGVGPPRHGLQAAGAVDVGDGRDERPLLRADGVDLDHERVGAIDGEPIAGSLLQNGGSKRAERLAALDLEVEDVLHVAAPGVGEDRTVAQGPRTPFRTPLIPAHDLAAHQGLGRLGRQAILAAHALDPYIIEGAILAARLRNAGRDGLADLRFLMGRSPVAVLHDETVARRAEHRVVHPEGGAESRAGVAGRGLNEYVLHVRLREEPAVGERVHAAAASQRQALEAGAFLEGAHQGEKALLVDPLQRGGQVLVALRQLLGRLARRSQQLREGRGEKGAEDGRAVVPGHVDALGEVPEV